MLSQQASKTSYHGLIFIHKLAIKNLKKRTWKSYVSLHSITGCVYYTCRGPTTFIGDKTTIPMSLKAFFEIQNVVLMLGSYI